MTAINVREVHAQICPGPADQLIFIGCAGFERRTTTVCDRLAGDQRWSKAIMFWSKEYETLGQSPDHRAHIQQRLSDITGQDVIPLCFAVDQPAAFLRAARTVIDAEITGLRDARIILDITTFPRQEFIVLLKLLLEVQPKPRLDIYYSEAGSYDTEREDGWLTRGVRKVRPIIGFGGVQPAGAKKLLLMVLGHEPERAAVTWKRHQPARMILVRTDPSGRPELDPLVGALHKEMFERITSADEHDRLPALGVVETRDLVLRIARANAALYYTIVAPLGTKLQTLGAALAALEDRRIQLTYAVPAVYNYATYSKDVGRVWSVSGVL